MTWPMRGSRLVVQRRTAHIDVEVGLAPRRQDDLLVDNGEFLDEDRQARLVGIVGHGVSFTCRGSVGRLDELNEIADTLVDAEGTERVVADVLAGRGTRQNQVRAQARLDAGAHVGVHAVADHRGRSE